MQEWLAGVIAGVITAIVISIAAIRSYYSLNKRGINKVYRIHLSSGEFFDVVLIANGILISPKLIPGLLNMSIVDKQTGEVFGEQKLPLSDKVMETVIEGELSMEWDGGGFEDALDGSFNFISDAIGYDQFSESIKVKITIEVKMNHAATETR